MAFSDKVHEFFSAQLCEWELAADNYKRLKDVRTRKISFGLYDVILQFNPERIRSTAASTDRSAVEARKCFLCRENRPAAQRDLPFNDSYAILINPFPIFNTHLTITLNQHKDQRIRDRFGDLLALSTALPGFVVFYNGPACGASAPDHLHFQAGESGFMPLEKDFAAGSFTRMISRVNETEILVWKGYQRGIITIKGINKEQMEDLFNNLYRKLSNLSPELPEPMMNIIACFKDKSFIVHFIPRKAHRPVQYFYQEEGQKIVVSPASVDLSGVIITPREEDFTRLGRESVSDILRQVCYSDDEVEIIARDLI
jgi:hypothetical protein